MNGMQNALTQLPSDWSIDMVTPLHALLSQNSHQTQLLLKMDSVCRLSAMYQRCLAVCPENPAKRILLNGQKAWNIICYDFRNDSDFRESIMPCWSTMGMTLTNHCTSMAQILHAEIIELMESGLHNLQQSMDALCRSVYSYDKCFVAKNYETCGVKAGKFLVKLTHQTSHALVELLDEVLGLTELPGSCLDWLSQKYLVESRPRGIAKRMKNDEWSSITSLFLAVLITRSLLLP
ncbi:hypothetical protein Aduo_019089 [Ancylostoma duodenale]